MKTLATISLITLSAAAALAATVSFAGNGVMGWYGDIGTGACGRPINGIKDSFAAVSAKHFTAPNPNNDPLCSQSVKVSYGGKSLVLPIKDKCLGCAANKIDVSKAAFAKFGDPSVGTLDKVTWSIVPTPPS